MTTINEDIRFYQHLRSLSGACQAITNRAAEFMLTQPQFITCTRHPDVQQAIDLELTRQASRPDKQVAGYTPCAKCQNLKNLIEQNNQLVADGTPDNLLHCHLATWRPANDIERGHLEKVREFIQAKRGFLILLGSVGCGKSHIAVGCMRFFKKPWLAKQNSLLRMLRATYCSDKTVTDPIKRAQKADLFCLDELGVSAGGKDEFGMLSDILDSRYCARKPTVITSNLSLDELKAIVGDRMADRLAESAFGVLTFSGESHRSTARDVYFSSKRTEQQLEAGEILRHRSGWEDEPSEYLTDTNCL